MGKLEKSFWYTICHRLPFNMRNYTGERISIHLTNMGRLTNHPLWSMTHNSSTRICVIFCTFEGYQAKIDYSTASCGGGCVQIGSSPGMRMPEKAVINGHFNQPMSCLQIHTIETQKHVIFTQCQSHDSQWLTINGWMILTKHRLKRHDEWFRPALQLIGCSAPLYRQKSLPTSLAVSPQCENSKLVSGSWGSEIYIYNIHIYSLVFSP
jgi:hypothetical protein